jgi:hypothetical protein
MPYKDPEKIKEYQKKYREANRQKLNEQNKKYYWQHRDELLAKNREYQTKHKEEIKEANKKYYENNKNEILTKRKPYSKKYYDKYKDILLEKSKKHYRNNKGQYTKRRKKFRDERSDWLLKFKSNLCCIRCGENHPRCLDFHHREPYAKEDLVSRLVKRASKDRILKEIAKCDVLCANCHRKHHCDYAKDDLVIGELVYEGVRNTPKYRKEYLKWVRKKRAKWFWDIKKNLSCFNCEEQNPACLDFHHKDHNTKDNFVGQMVSSALSESKILSEIEKCDVLCANCHIKHHSNI